MPLPEGARTDLVVVIGWIIALNLLNGFVLESWPEALVQLGGSAVAVGYAVWRGYSRDDLALSGAAVGSGLRIGAIFSAVIVAGIVAVALLPLSRDMLADDRFAELSTAEAVYEIVVRIPLITALTEELLFRSVLLAILLAMTTTFRAVMWSSLVFALWHVVTTANGLGGNDATESISAAAAVGSVGVAVVATGVAGLLFAWSRVRSGSIVAPWLIHIAFNSTTFTAGVILAS